MKRWHVAFTQPRAEAQAAWHLANQGFEPFLPLCRTLRRHARQVTAVARPLFPRYLFVAFDPERERFRAVGGTRGISHLVMAGDRPAPVPAGVVEALQAQADPFGIVPLASLALFERGAAVRITDGALAGQIGRYETLTPDRRVVLLLDLLGRQVTVEVPVYAVEAA
jgi:transcriptional antiterminator RfaH